MIGVSEQVAEANPALADFLSGAGLASASFAAGEGWHRGLAVFAPDEELCAAPYDLILDYGARTPSFTPATMTAPARLAYGEADLPFGNALTTGPLRLVAGLVILGAGIVSIWRLAAERRVKETLLWVILFFFAPFNALMTGIGRLGYGVKIAATSRYQSVTAITLIAMIVLVLSAEDRVVASRNPPAERGLRRTSGLRRGHRHRPVLCRQLYSA